MGKKVETVNNANSVPLGAVAHRQDMEETQGDAQGRQGDEAQAVTGGDLATVMDTLAGAMPEAQEHAINEAAQESPYADLKDIDGNPFDSNVHKTDAAGKPVLNAQNKLLKKRGRKAGQTNSKVNIPQGAQQFLPVNPVVKMRATGRVYANTLISLMVGFFGNEWIPEKSAQHDEREYLETVFADYCEATGKQDLPPGIALAFGLVGYVGPRLRKPATVSKLTALKDQISARIAQWRAKKSAEKIKAASAEQ